MTTQTHACFKAYDIRGKLGEELNDVIAYRIGRASEQHMSNETVGARMINFALRRASIHWQAVDRDFARSLFEPGEFYEVFVDTPIEECESRDVKGLYAKARLGKIANFTGIDSPYEAPETPEVTLNTLKLQPEKCVESLVQSMQVQSN